MPTVNDEIADSAARHTIYLMRWSTGTYRRQLNLIDKAIADLSYKLNIRPPASGTLTEARLVAMLDESKAVSTELYTALNSAVNGEFKELAAYESRFQVNAIQSAYPIELALNTVPPAQLYSAAMSQPFRGRILKDWWASQSVGFRSEVDTAVRIGYVEGESLSQITSRFKNLSGKAKRDMEAVVRTATNHMASVARKEMTIANEDIFSHDEWSSTLDGRTSAICFPAGTMVKSCGASQQIFRAKYAGEMVVITTSSGKKLRGTPNHPILTPNGFLPLHKIKPGQKIINAAFNNVGMIQSDNNISMETDIAEVYNSSVKKPVFNRIRKSASAVDFYGDGVGMNSKIDIATANSHLSSDAISGVRQSIENILFGFIEDGSLLSIGSQGQDSFMRKWLAKVTSEINSVFIKQPVDSGFASMKFFCDFDGLHSIIKKLQSHSPIALNVYIRLAALKCWHDFISFEQRCYGGGSCIESSAKFGGTNPISVELDDVVSVMSKFESCHVYTLGCSLGFYTAEGIIVKNCISLDGKRYKIGKGPFPPAHFRCRSSRVPITKTWKELGFEDMDENEPLSNRPFVADKRRVKDIPKSERSRLIGTSSAKTYSEFAKSQPLSFFQDVAGDYRGELAKNGELPLSKLVKNGQWMTIEQIEASESKAIKAARQKAFG